MARRPNTRARWTCDKEDYEVMQLTASVLLMMGARTCGSETAAGARSRVTLHSIRARTRTRVMRARARARAWVCASAVSPQ